MRTAPRSLEAIQEDLRGIPALRAAHRTGPRADLMFRNLIDRRADRLLDELLRLREYATQSTPRQ